MKDSLISLGTNFGHCRGQGYDGARNFQGCISCVAKRFENENKSAISVHCLAHCMNLYLEDIARGKCIKEASNFVMEFIQLIKYSLKRQVVFEKIQTQHEDSPASKIQTLCPTSPVQELCREFLTTTSHFKKQWNLLHMEVMIVLEELVVY